MPNYFKENLIYLRSKKNENQSETATALGLSRSTYANYETGDNLPKLDIIVKICGHFGISMDDLYNTDLQNVHLNKKVDDKKTDKNVHPNVHPSVHLSGKKGYKPHELIVKVLAEDPADYAYNTKVIPITDISVAAGPGHFNNEWIEDTESIKLPMQFLKRDATYLCVKIKGVSMAPTMQDGGYVVIRQLDRSEWANMPDESVFVVADNEGKSYLKRVKNRFKNGFIVLRSDSPDRATFPSFNLAAEEIVSIWFVEWYFTAKMPNIHDQYYTRLQLLEDRVDELASKRS